MFVRWLCEREQCDDGEWMVSVSLLRAVVEWRWCVLLLSRLSPWCGP
nr:MAG TPA: hypothetical protein [Caudoviricetes sp.]